MLASDVYCFDGLDTNLECGYKCMVTVSTFLCDVTFTKEGDCFTISGQEAVDMLIEIGNQVESGKDLRDSINMWVINYLKNE